MAGMIQRYQAPHDTSCLRCQPQTSPLSDVQQACIFHAPYKCLRITCKKELVWALLTNRQRAHSTRAGFVARGLPHVLSKPVSYCCNCLRLPEKCVMSLHPKTHCLLTEVSYDLVVAPGTGPWPCRVPSAVLQRLVASNIAVREEVNPYSCPPF